MLNIAFPSKARGASRSFPPIGACNSLHESLAERAERVVAQRLLPKGGIVMCGESDAVAVEGQRLATQERANFLTVPEEELSVDWLAEHAGEIDVLLVDADYLGDVEDTVDFCLRVRRGCASLPIILISSEIRGDDFTCERMHACDVTLRNSVSRIRLENAIRTAFENNAYYLASRS